PHGWCRALLHPVACKFGSSCSRREWSWRLLIRASPMRTLRSRRLTVWLAKTYLWIKALHIVSMVAWIAGLLYLPRLYVYHSTAPSGSDRSETFKVMERRLQNGIMTPAMIATWTFGLVLAGTPGVVDWHLGWIWAKLAVVVGLTGFHIALARWRTAFLAD